MSLLITPFLSLKNRPHFEPAHYTDATVHSVSFDASICLMGSGNNCREFQPTREGAEHSYS